MAEQSEKNASSSSKRTFALRTLVALVLMLLLQAGVVSTVFFIAGQPADVRAEGANLDEAHLEEPVELLLVEDRFQNTRTGRAYLYDTEIYIVVPRKHQETVRTRLENMRAQVTTEIATIFRRAEPSHLLEPELSTLTRQLKAMTDRRFGYDEEGEPYIQEVLIRRCMQFPAN